MTDVFISYSRVDSDFVRRLHGEFAARTREAWVDWEDIAPTAEWMKEIQAAIEQAEVFVFVISPDSIASEVCAVELNHAFSHNKRIVPVVFREVDSRAMPERLASLNWMFIREEDDFQTGFETLVKAIDTDLDWVRVHTRLLVRAREWESHASDKSYLLRGKDLTEVEDWLSNRGDLEPPPTALQTQFMIASRKATTRRKQGILSAVATALVIAIGFAVLAWIQRNRAIEQAEIAKSRQLVANAQQQLPINPDLSLRLMLESASIRKTDTTERALREMLGELRVRAVLDGYALGVNGQTISPDGQLVVRKDGSGTVDIWHLDESRRIRTLADCPTDITTVAFSPSGDHVATGHADGRLLIWDAATGQTLGEAFVTTDSVANAAFNPVGNVIVTLAADGKAQEWSVETGELLKEIAGEPANEQASLSFDRKGGVLSIERDYRRMLYRMPGAVPIQEQAGFFSQDGKRWFAETCRACDAEVHEAGAGLMASGFDGAFGKSAVFSSDGRWLLRSGVCWGPGACDFVSRIYDTESGELRNTLQGHSDRVFTAAFSSDDRFIVTSSADGTARVWVTQTGALLTTLIGHSGEVFSAAFSANGRHVITASRDGTARVWDAGTGVSRFEIRSDQETVSHAKFVSGGERIVTIGKDGSERWWQTLSGAAAEPESFDPTEVPSGQIEATLERIEASGVGITGFLESPRGRYVITESTPWIDPDQNADGTARVWDVLTNGQLAEIPPSASGNSAAVLAISPDEGLIATTDHCRMTIDCDRLVYLRELATARPIRALRGHGNQVIEAAFDSSGKVLATSDQEGGLRLWHVDTGGLIAELLGHGDSARIEFSPRGETLLTTDSRGAMFVYACEACGALDALLARAEKRSVRDLTCQERRAYVDDTLDCP